MEGVWGKAAQSCGIPTVMEKGDAESFGLASIWMGDKVCERLLGKRWQGYQVIRLFQSGYIWSQHRTTTPSSQKTAPVPFVSWQKCGQNNPHFVLSLAGDFHLFSANIDGDHLNPKSVIDCRMRQVGKKLGSPSSNLLLKAWSTLNGKPLQQLRERFHFRSTPLFSSHTNIELFLTPIPLSNFSTFD